jgi:hypothetical protein
MIAAVMQAEQLVGESSMADLGHQPYDILHKINRRYVRYALACRRGAQHSSEIVASLLRSTTTS